MLDADRTPVSAAQVAAARRGYRAAISLVDEHVGTLLTALDEQQLREETVVVVTSDHGDMLGERGLWYKMAPFEPSIRVPLIISGAGVARGSRRGARLAARPGADAGGARRRRLTTPATATAEASPGHCEERRCPRATSHSSTSPKVSDRRR